MKNHLTPFIFSPLMGETKEGVIRLIHPHLGSLLRYGRKELILTLILVFSLQGRRKFRRIIFRYRRGN
jgi:hypothetical protein